MMACPLLIVLLALSTMVHINAQVANKGITCLSSNSFKDTCTKLNGVQDESRCFFIAEGKSDWFNAFSTCSGQYGAALAQLHSAREFSLMAQFGDPEGFWIALRRSSLTPGKSNTITDSTTFWYDTFKDAPNQFEVVTSTNLAAGNTWIYRYHATDNFQSTDPDQACMVDTGSSIKGIDCSSSRRVLCQITNQLQTYKKTDICMIEEPIESSTTADAQACAELCSLRLWCRSFNFITSTNGGTCQLFPWSVVEQCPQCPDIIEATEAKCCVHYNYGQGCQLSASSDNGTMCYGFPTRTVPSANDDECLTMCKNMFPMPVTCCYADAFCRIFITDRPSFQLDGNPEHVAHVIQCQ